MILFAKMERFKRNIAIHMYSTLGFLAFIANPT